MALLWPSFGGFGNYIDVSVGTLGAITQGAYTIAALTLPSSSRSAFLSARIAGSGAWDRELLIDTSLEYGAGDFSSGWSPPGGLDTTGTKWQWTGQRKAAGSQPYEHFYRMQTGGLGTLYTGISTGQANHPDSGSAATFIRLGEGDTDGRYAHAVLAMWLRRVTDTDLDSICSNSAYSLLSTSPAGLWLMNVSAAANVVDSSGNGHNPTTVSGGSNITSVADPSGYNFSLTPPGIADSDSFSFSEVIRITVKDSDAPFGFSEIFRGSVADSDSGLLSETMRGSMSMSESYTLDDTVARISIFATDVFLFAAELEKLGLNSVDAFTVADATFSGNGKVTSGETFALVESQSLGGLPDDRRKSPITIKLTSPSIKIGLTSPSITINLNH